MGKDSFQFKQFTVEQGHCAMRVGTDGTLLGAWAEGGTQILDIGTGTGLIALMMAQRCPEAHVTGIDIDEEAARQATENALASPFHDRISIVHSSLQDFASEWQGGKFDAIVSNPPFFNDTKATANSHRDLARHTLTLTYRDLFRHASALLTDEGTLSIVIPYSMRGEAFAESAINGLRIIKEVDITTTPTKAPKRALLSFGIKAENIRSHETQCLSDGNGHRSPWFHALTEDFYLG